MSDSPKLDTALLMIKLFPHEIDRVRGIFKTVYYYPDPEVTIPAEELAATEVLVTHPYTGVYGGATSLDQMPKLVLVQNAATGVERVLKSKIFASATTEQLDKLHFANAAGGYSLNIGGFILNYVTSLYNLIPSMVRLQASRKEWVEADDIQDEAGLTGPYGSKTIYGKTFGFLGYGSLGREFARMCSVFPAARIIAANSSGERKTDDTFTFPGCGDTEAKIPEKFYSTSDPQSLKEFLSETDVLISSLPSTKHTTDLLDAEKLSWMKPHGLFINVGRGTIIRGEDILTALDAPGGLWGAAIDVSNPEPLPKESPLWHHKRLMITPHMSGETENEYTTSITILETNVGNLREGKAIFNSIDHRAGY